MQYSDNAGTNSLQNKGRPMSGINSVSQIVALMRTQMVKKVRPASKPTGTLKSQGLKKESKQKALEAPGKIEELISLRGAAGITFFFAKTYVR
ncbi:hypothetical protein [Undibacterium sp. TS12]|uniref:hypothetical protein n=1 Tax=Undibacterium sp. TS12 TaxID=2908202 RepID=UPI001F4CFB3D|nr:hypothetical protein [Undibacterium sp. TS12]MCH8618743.1 hypothetical protein [Undibacterium sp. TS12]